MPESSGDRCPKCGGPSVGSCRCPRGDSSCANGHEWHTCTIHNVVVDGPSDHSTDTFSCTCPSQPVQVSREGQ